jgi:hypothetical protein
LRLLAREPHLVKETTPYGRLAAVADPTGAGFNLSSLEG